MVEKIIGGYLLLAFLMSLSVMLLNKNTLKKMKNWQVLLFFLFSPILAIREIFKRP